MVTKCPVGKALLIVSEIEMSCKGTKGVHWSWDCFNALLVNMDAGGVVYTIMSSLVFALWNCCKACKY